MKIISWNVNGIRSILKKDLFYPLVKDENPDIICLQEVRATGPQYQLNTQFRSEYPYRYTNESTTKKGYSGTAVFSKIKPIDEIEVSFNDQEGRVIALEFEEFFLVTVYVPNSGSQFDYRINTFDHDFRNFLEILDSNKSVIVCGDFNIAHQSIDIYNPKIKNVAGVTPEEKENFGKLLTFLNDSFRIKNPSTKKFSWWSNFYKARSKNNGWRIDYFLVSKNINEARYRSDILSEHQGSDHAPCLFQLD